MFVSVKFLQQQLGVDPAIARFFVDRKVPQDNAFWTNRLLYVGRGNGFMFIPLYYDLLFRLGIPQDRLLAEPHVQFMERIMHHATRVEKREMTFGVQLGEIKKFLGYKGTDQAFYEGLVCYLQQDPIEPLGILGKPWRALNRGDAFLFILCDLPLGPGQITDAVRYWYALITSFLLMDDIYDYPMDKQQQEENSIIELGDGELGFMRAFDILEENQKILQEINPLLSKDLNRQTEELHTSTLQKLTLHGLR
jgi:hypothetical protein